MDQGMARIKVHATEEHRDGRVEARERRHSSMKDGRSSGEQAEAVGQDMRWRKIHASWESANDRGGGHAWRSPQSDTHPNISDRDG